MHLRNHSCLRYCRICHEMDKFESLQRDVGVGGVQTIRSLVSSGR